jgi:hypothetical protein
MVGMSANGFEDHGARDTVKPGGAKSSQLSIRRDRDHIQITAVKRHTLNVPVPFPALVLLVWLIRVKHLPGEPAAGR